MLPLPLCVGCRFVSPKSQSFHLEASGPGLHGASHSIHVNHVAQHTVHTYRFKGCQHTGVTVRRQYFFVSTHHIAMHAIAAPQGVPVAPGPCCPRALAGHAGASAMTEWHPKHALGKMSGLGVCQGGALPCTRSAPTSCMCGAPISHVHALCLAVIQQLPPSRLTPSPPQCTSTVPGSACPVPSGWLTVSRLPTSNPYSCCSATRRGGAARAGPCAVAAPRPGRRQRAVQGTPAAQQQQRPQQGHDQKPLHLTPRQPEGGSSGKARGGVCHRAWPRGMRITEDMLQPSLLLARGSTQNTPLEQGGFSNAPRHPKHVAVAGS